MSDFTFTNSDGVVVREVWKCTECIYCSTKRQFRTGDDVTCPLCRAPAQQINEMEQNEGMTDFSYQLKLDWLQENRSGIGDAMIENIEETYPEGDDFVDACKEAYEERNFSEITEISGVGEATAHKKIVLGMAEQEGWSGGKAELLSI